MELLKFRNESPTPVDISLWHHCGLYRTPDSTKDYIGYVECHVDNTDQFPMHLEVPAENVDVESGLFFNDLSETVGINLAYMDDYTLQLVLDKMKELGWQVNMGNQKV